jgi:hypothetical protein
MAKLAIFVRSAQCLQFPKRSLCSDRSPCPVPDARFLLRFLRTKKFSVLQAQEALERYLLLRQTYGPAFRNLDYTDHTMNELISNGYVLNILRNVVLVMSEAVCKT